ncbi:MAG: coenzyme F420-0:L-glutamate ligase [Chloroflexi bacterium]|nr:coenzyme F420-0:L-glutamate ligase [Chloroflexota bacterium]
MTVTAVLPFRSIDSAKSRMAPLLSEEERREFSARLLERTLLALGRAASLHGVILVSPDPLARALARSGGHEALDDGGVDLNVAISLGVRHAATSGASAVLILPVDLAEISAANIDALLSGWSGSKPGLLASPDGGTSALLVPLPHTFTPQFGANSAAAHQDELSRDGGTVERLSSPLAADLDTPNDLQIAMERERTAATPVPTEGLLALPIDGLGEIQPGDDLPEMIASCVATIAATSAIGGLRSDDVIAVTQKIVSKAEGAIVELTTITPRPEAVEYAAKWGRDARQVEVVLQEAVRVVRMDRGVIITETAHGFVLANSGVDASNVGPRSGEVVTLLPRDPDGSARAIREAIRLRTGVAPGVIITDSFGRPWRLGITDVAIGVAGIAALEDLRGKPDADGRMMAATVRAVADQIAATAELALGKTARRPLALIRGAHPQVAEDGSARSSLMPPDWDLFR